MASNAAAGHKLSSDVLKEQYRVAKRFTLGTVFGCGNGVLNAFSRDKVVRRREAREEKEAAAVGKHRKNLRDLREQVQDTRSQIVKKGNKFKHTIQTLKPLVKWKMLSANYKKHKPPKKNSIPTERAKLLEKYKQIKGLPSPYWSSSDDEDESDWENSDSELEEEQAAAGLEFNSHESHSNDEAQSDEEDE